MTLDQHLKLARIDVNDFAAAVGVHRSTIYRVLKGDGCTRKTARRIENATGGLVSAAEILAAQRVPELDDDTSSSTGGGTDGCGSDPDDDATEEGDAVTALPLRAGRVVKRRPSAPPFDFRRAG